MFIREFTPGGLWSPVFGLDRVVLAGAVPGCDILSVHVWCVSRGDLQPLKGPNLGWREPFHHCHAHQACLLWHPPERSKSAVTGYCLSSPPNQKPPYVAALSHSMLPLGKSLLELKPLPCAAPCPLRPGLLATLLPALRPSLSDSSVPLCHVGVIMASSSLHCASSPA